MGRQGGGPFKAPPGWKWCSYRKHFDREDRFAVRKDGYVDSFCRKCRAAYYQTWKGRKVGC